MLGKATTEKQVQIVPTWHDPEELRDRLNQPKVTLEEMRAQFRRTMSSQASVTPKPGEKQGGCGRGHSTGTVTMPVR